MAEASADSDHSIEEIIGDVTETSTEPSTKKKKGGKDQYNSYEYYTKTADNKWKCKLCPTEFTYNVLSRTKVGHYEKCHSFKPINKYFKGDVTKTSPSSFREAVLDFVVKSHLPLQIVEEESFRNLLDYVHMMNEDVPKTSSSKVKSDLLKGYNSEKSRVIGIIKKCESVALTLDGWTSTRNKKFLAITCHFIHDKKLKNCLIAFRHFPSPCGANEQLALLKRALEDVIDLDKVSAIASDNATVNSAMMDLIKTEQELISVEGELFKTSWIRCSSHILNLIVTSGLEKTEPLIDKVRAVAKAFKGSPGRLEDLEKAVKNFNEKFLTPIVDSPTRWNSTLQMLQRIVSMKRTISYFLEDPNYFRSELTPISNSEWLQIGRLGDVLIPFMEATEILSGSKYVTLSLVLPLFLQLKADVIKAINEEEDVTKTAGLSPESMTKTFKKYLDLITSNKTAAIATALDPRFNLKFFIKKKPSSAQVEKWVREEFEKVAEDVMETPQEKQDKSLKSKIFSHSEVADELAEYFKSPKLGEEADPIEWWESRKTSSRRLHSLAIRYLGMPASSVPSEQVFSKAGLVITKRRSRLNSSVIEQLLCYESFKSLK